MRLPDDSTNPSPQGEGEKIREKVKFEIVEIF